MRSFLFNAGSFREERMLKHAFTAGGEGFRNNEQVPQQDVGNIDFHDLAGARNARTARMNAMRQQFGGRSMPRRAPGSQHIDVPAISGDARFGQMRNRFQPRLDRYGEQPNFRERVRPRLNHYGYRPAREYYGNNRPAYRSGYNSRVGAYRGRPDAYRARVEKDYQTINKYRRLGTTGVGHQHFNNRALAGSLGIDMDTTHVSENDVKFQRHVARLDQQRIIDEQRALNQQLDRQRQETDRLLSQDNRTPSVPPARTETVTGTFRARRPAPTFERNAPPPARNTPPARNEAPVRPPAAERPTPTPETPVRPAATPSATPETPPVPKPDVAEVSRDDRADEITRNRELMAEATENGFDFSDVSSKGKSLGVRFVDTKEGGKPVAFFARQNADGKPVISNIDEYDGIKRVEKNSPGMQATLQRFEGRELTKGIFNELRDAIDVARDGGKTPGLLEGREALRQRQETIRNLLKPELLKIGVLDDQTDILKKFTIQFNESSNVWVATGYMPASNERVTFEITDNGNSLTIQYCKVNTVDAGARSESAKNVAVPFASIIEGKVTIEDPNAFATAIAKFRAPVAREARPTLPVRGVPRAPEAGETAEGSRAITTLIDIRSVLQAPDIGTIDPDDITTRSEINTMLTEYQRDCQQVIDRSSLKEVKAVLAQLTGFVRDDLKDTNSSVGQRAEFNRLLTALQNRERTLRAGSIV